MFQFCEFLPELSVIENVALPLRLLGTRREHAGQTAADWLRRLDVAASPTLYAATLSGGELQYDRLTNDALLKASLALELGLRHRLGRGNRVRLVELIDQGVATGLLPASDDAAWVWTELRKNRNALAHGGPSVNSYGPGASYLIGRVIDAVNALYQRGDE